ncbi:MAG: histidine kinase [Acidimicrobiia bacterium]|nr:histidine kinase [Acidimicrobiia bacterium]
MRLLRAGVALYLVSVVVTLVQLRSYEIATLTAFGAYVLVGGMIVVLRDNRFGLMLVAYGAIWAMATAAAVTGEALEEAGQVDAASWATLVAMVAGSLTIWLIAATWLVFPDGRPSTATDRKLLWGSGALAAIVTVLGFFSTPQALPETKAFPHPFIDDEVARALYGISQIPIILFFLFGYVVAARLIVRMRHGDSKERRQVGWIAASVIANITILIGNVAIAPLGTEDKAFLMIDAVAIVLIPLGIGVAIFRYRLYDIDVIVSKSVTYLGLAAAIGGLYAAVVVLPLLVIGRSDGEGPGLVLPIAATAVVAVVFEPIRTRMQRWANRLVYGNRVSPYEVLSQVTSRLAESSIGNGTDDLARLLVEGTGAEQAIVWLKVDDVLRPEGVFSHDAPGGIEPIPAGGLVDDDLTESQEVVHRGEVIGALSLTKASNDPITPEDRELLSDVAAGAGLLLRNIGLNRELEQRALEVRASRRRLIAAQDAERHRLERDLHDGAQQQVVALKVKLGIAKTLAQREEADEIATRVAALADETQQAVDALRAVAHGIYPPLLEAEGLESALRAVERTSHIPLAVDVGGITRYARPIEETVYFSVLETVERARMSRATGMSVRLTGFDDELTMLVDVQGASGLDVTVVSDRVDAAGGTLSIDETDDATALTARFPISDSTAMASSPSDLVSEPS